MILVYGMVPLPKNNLLLKELAHFDLIHLHYLKILNHLDLHLYHLCLQNLLYQLRRLYLHYLDYQQ